jgi:hypothetical protein
LALLGEVVIAKVREEISSLPSLICRQLPGLGLHDTTPRENSLFPRSLKLKEYSKEYAPYSPIMVTLPTDFGRNFHLCLSLFLQSGGASL